MSSRVGSRPRRSCTPPRCRAVVWGGSNDKFAGADRWFNRLEDGGATCREPIGVAEQVHFGKTTLARWQGHQEVARLPSMAPVPGLNLESDVKLKLPLTHVHHLTAGQECGREIATIWVLRRGSVTAVLSLRH